MSVHGLVIISLRILEDESMEIISYSSKYLEDLINLWNDSVASVSIFKPFTVNSFKSKILDNPYFNEEGLVILVKNNQVIGWGLAVVKDQSEDTPGFIVCVAIDKNFQRQGYGTLLLQQLEQFLIRNNKKKVRLYFASPINLEWIVPGTNNHDHPGAPAVSYNTPFYFLLKANHYIIDGPNQDAFHLDITNYEKPIDIVKKIQVNEQDGYFITYYDPSKHNGLDDLFVALQNPTWHEAAKNNLRLEKPNPMLVVVKDNRVLGWTGPLYTQESGRGYFAGIGVHPEVQGRGLGKTLFSELCYRSKENGAKFMTLFTGSNNPARNIYLSAGFKIVQSFAILGKELIK